jgi:hypothetical protein
MITDVCVKYSVSALRWKVDKATINISAAAYYVSPAPSISKVGYFHSKSEWSVITSAPETMTTPTYSHKSIKHVLATESKEVYKLTE